MPLARNLAKTALVLELMVRGASASTGSGSGNGEGGEDAGAGAGAVGGAAGLAQLLGREEGELLALPVEVLHALSRTCWRWMMDNVGVGRVHNVKSRRVAHWLG